MNRLGLGSADFKKYLARCALPHTVVVAVELQTNEGVTLVSFDQGRGGGRDVTVTDGQVDVDASTIAGRSLSLTVADPSGELLVSQDANYVDRMLNVQVGVAVPELQKTIWADVFTGPITDAPRSGDVVQFTAQGKAMLGQHGIRELYTIPRGTKKTTAIRRILTDLAGETAAHLHEIPDLPPVLTKQLVLHLKSRPWEECQKIAVTLNRHIAYDGKGNVRLQRIDLTNPVYTFSDASNRPGLVDTDPEVSTNWKTILNAVKLTGGSTGSGAPPVVYAFPDPDNPFSPQRLGRNGVNAYFWDIRTYKHQHTAAGLQIVADNILARDMIAVREVKFEAMPMYVFDELDLVGVHLPGFIGQTRLGQFTIPLNLDGSPTMSFGFNHRVSAAAFTRRHN